MRDPAGDLSIHEVPLMKSLSSPDEYMMAYNPRPVSQCDHCHAMTGRP
jgi:hypothetical protein